MLPRSCVSKRCLKQLKAIGQQYNTGKLPFALPTRPFRLFGTSLLPLPKDQLAYKRRNRKFIPQTIVHPGKPDCLIGDETTNEAEIKDADSTLCPN
jgi:hypothetical protein